jgi:endonuclease YncB( thermonuclease family)
MSPIRQLLADVVDALTAAEVVDPKTNSAIDGDTFKVDYLPRFEATDLKDLRIVVAPRQNTSTKISRSTREFEFGVQIAVIQTAAKDSERFAQLLDLTHELDAALATATIDTGVWSRSEVSLYDIDALERHGAFRSVITAYFKNRS